MRHRYGVNVDITTSTKLYVQYTYVFMILKTQSNIAYSKVQ